jgi:3'(2'), 5'-bisphosphate nucleotidase
VSDAHGNALNFGVGRTLRENKGVVAATKNIHAEVIAAVKAELAKAQL